MRDRKRKKKGRKRDDNKKNMKGIMGNRGRRDMGREILGKEWGWKRERVINERI